MGSEEGLCSRLIAQFTPYAFLARKCAMKRVLALFPSWEERMLCLARRWYEENTLYFPEPALFSCTLEQQFYGGHSAFDAPAITRELADSGSWIFSREEIDAIWKQNSFIGCNMARGGNVQYKQFMSALFVALAPIWHKHEEQFLRIGGYDKRALAFIAERLITGMVLYRDKLFPGMNIATAPIGFIH